MIIRSGPDGPPNQEFGAKNANLKLCYGTHGETDKTSESNFEQMRFSHLPLSSLFSEAANCLGD